MCKVYVRDNQKCTKEKRNRVRENTRVLNNYFALNISKECDIIL